MERGHRAPPLVQALRAGSSHPFHSRHSLSFPFLLGQNRVPGAAVRGSEPAQLRALRSPGACAGPGQPVLGDLRGAEPLDRGDAGPDLPAAPSGHRPRAAQAAAGGHEGKAMAELQPQLVGFFPFWGSYKGAPVLPHGCHSMNWKASRSTDETRGAWLSLNLLPGGGKENSVVLLGR